MISCIVATGFSPRIGTPQSFILMCLRAPTVHEWLSRMQLTMK
jgi:hypothetical protein